MSTLEVDGRAVTLSHPERVLWPAIDGFPGWTKRDLVAYVRAAAPAMLPHLRRRAVTLRRFPEGLEGPSFYQTRCPEGRPSWVPTVTVVSPAKKTLCLVHIEDEATLVWTANLATLELHPFLAPIDAPDAPHAAVLDLDPGAPANILDCARVAIAVRELLGAMGLAAFVKTSGAKGLHLYVPLRDATYAQTRSFVKWIAGELRAADPTRITDRMPRAERAGKVFVDWGQNDAWKSTVAPYSLRATRVPLVSTPITWDELEEALAKGAPNTLRFTPHAALARIAQHGDLFRPVLELVQRLP